MIVAIFGALFGSSLTKAYDNYRLNEYQERITISNQEMINQYKIICYEKYEQRISNGPIISLIEVKDE